MGLILTALFAGIKPANIPENISIINADIAIRKSTSEYIRMGGWKR